MPFTSFAYFTLIIIHKGYFLSLKENIDMVREELNQEEKMFENAVRTERFVKKYKTPLLSAIVAIIVVLVGNSIYQANLESKMLNSNAAYMTLLGTPTDTNAMKILKDNNAALYDAWKLQVAIADSDEKTLQELSGSQNKIVSDIATYEVAALKKDVQALNAYAQKKDAILKDMALLDEAVLLMKAGKTEEAHKRLNLIDEKSSVKKTAMILQHYGVK